VLVLAAASYGCQSGPTSSKASPAATPTPSTEPTSSASPSPSAPVVSPAPTPSPVKAICSFPVLGVDGQGNETGYFLSVPSGAKTVVKTVMNQSGLLYQTVDRPYLLGRSTSGGVYDRAVGRWLPADWPAVSPDGTHFAYASGAPGGPNELHIVDVRTGSDRLAASSGQYYPLDYQSSVLYLSQRNGGSQLWTGSSVFVLDLKTNGIRTLHTSSRTEIWSLVFGGFAYGADINPSDPHPPGAGKAPDELVRLDLKSGAVIRFQYHPGISVSPAGITPAGQLVAGIGGVLRLIDAAGKAIAIPAAPANASLYVDSQRAWILAGDPRSAAGSTRKASIYLLSNGRAVHEMDFQWASNDQLAGACR
jgi:WD40 repeat protein